MNLASGELAKLLEGAEDDPFGSLDSEEELYLLSSEQISTDSLVQLSDLLAGDPSQD